MPRSRLGPLAIESKLGDDPSQGSVWRAIHLKQQKAVAVKIFPIPFAATEASRSDFADECQLLKTIRHPAIVRCYGGGIEESDAYLAYELIDGETLASTLQRRGRLSWEAVLELSEPLADALAYLHRRDLCHGRVQPDKIMLSGESPKLLDVRSDRQPGPLASPRGDRPSELAYRAPEHVKEPAALSVPGDLYSLGAVMYQALTGRPPRDGDTAEAFAEASVKRKIEPAASIVMDCPVWLDKLVSQLLQTEPAKRPRSAEAVKMSLGEVRKRSMSKSGVAEHVSAGFSPLQVTDQRDRDEARKLLGRNIVELQDDQPVDDSSWYDKPWVLLLALASVIGVLAYFMWPLDEDDMRQRAEALLKEDNRHSMMQAKMSFLVPMIKQFPEGRHRQWAEEQIEQVEMVEAEHALSIKMKGNLALTNEGERLYAAGQRYERFGDDAAALDQYRSIVTLMAGQAEYEPFVNLARRQIATIETERRPGGEATTILRGKLQEAEREYRQGNVVAARRIWYSIIDLYGNSSNVAPLVERAQARLAAASPDGPK